MFTIRPVAVGIGANIITGMALFGGVLVLPLYMQIVHAASPMKSGFLMLPMVGGMMTGSIISGQITSRTGHIRVFPIFGSLLAAISLLLLSTITADTRLIVVMGFMLLLGFGLGNCMQPLTVIVQNAVPPREIGVATSSATFFRQIGGTIGVAVFLSVLFSTVGGNIANAFRDASQTTEFVQATHDPDVLANPLNQQVVEGLSGQAHDGGIFAQVQDDSSVLAKMADVFSHPFKVGFADSMSTVFFWAGLIGFLAFFVLLLMPKVELRSQSAMAAARTESLAPTAPLDNEVG
jgi:hypothetical protein